jgi:uncharacterized protein YqfA (UPF0365 family)
MQQLAMQQVIGDGGDTFFLLFAVVAMLIFALLALVMFSLVAGPWIRAAASGAPISFLSLLGMRMRGNPQGLLVDAYIALRRARVNASIVDVEGTYMDHRTRVRTHDDLVELVKSTVANRDTLA